MRLIVIFRSNPRFVLPEDIEDIKMGNRVENKTQLLENYIDFTLPNYYQSLYAHLLKKGMGYQGLIYRQAVEI
jgi:hypothetical protein